MFYSAGMSGMLVFGAAIALTVIIIEGCCAHTIIQVCVYMYMIVRTM